MSTAQTLTAPAPVARVTESVPAAPAGGASAPSAESVSTCRTPGRRRLRGERLVRVTFSVPPALMDAVETLGGNGFGKKATVVRALVEAGIAGGGVERIVAEAASAEISREKAHADTNGAESHSVGSDGVILFVHHSAVGNGVSDESANVVESHSVMCDDMNVVKSHSTVVDGATADGGEVARVTDAPTDAEQPRRPGPGRRRVGREAMVLVSTLMEPATLAQVEAVADRANLPRGHVLRRLAEMGLEHILVAGYQAVAEASAA